jgi:hypothetical protein
MLHFRTVRGQAVAVRRNCREELILLCCFISWSDGCRFLAVDIALSCGLKLSELADYLSSGSLAAGQVDGEKLNQTGGEEQGRFDV